MAAKSTPPRTLPSRFSYQPRSEIYTDSFRFFLPFIFFKNCCIAQARVNYQTNGRALLASALGYRSLIFELMAFVKFSYNSNSHCFITHLTLYGDLRTTNITLPEIYCPCSSSSSSMSKQMSTFSKGLTMYTDLFERGVTACDSSDSLRYSSYIEIFTRCSLLFIVTSCVGPDGLED